MKVKILLGFPCTVAAARQPDSKHRPGLFQCTTGKERTGLASHTLAGFAKQVVLFPLPVAATPR